MKKLSRIFALITAMLFMTACSNTTGNNKTSNENSNTEKLTVSDKELKIGTLPAESAIPIILAKEKGFFEELGLNVSIKAFSSPNDRNVAVQAKEVDGTIGDIMTVSSFVDKGIPMKITSDISEDFKILSSPKSGITSMSGLSEKKVSLVPNFILEYIMDKFADKDNFKYEIVEIPSFSGRAEALLSNQIDGVVFTEPQAGMLVKQGANLLGSSKDLNIKGGTISFNNEIISERPGDIKAFYEAYNKAIDYMNNTNVSEYSAILSNYQFPEAISQYLSNITGNFQHAGEISEDQLNDIVNWTKDKGLINKTYTYGELTDFSFIK